MGLLSKAAARPGRGSLLRKIGRRKEAAALSAACPDDSPDAEAEIGRFLRDHGSFQGIVLRLLSDTEKEAFIPRTKKILSPLGAVCSLSPQSCLILVSGDIDSELLAHRLSKSLKTGVLHRFRAGTLEGALEQVSPYR
ncbi:MAG: hypothetical protein LBS06_03300 [Treponema sp.]|jgi:hypothetical protein|nr:hypothetical protein [Treponema sp.]